MSGWQRNSQARHERGTFLLQAVFTNALLLLAIVNYLPIYLNTLRLTSLEQTRNQTLALAEAGLAHAWWELNANGAAMSATDGWSAELGPTACDDEIDGGTDGRLYGLTVTSCRRLMKTLAAGDPSGTSIGTYTVWVVNLGSSSVRLASRGNLLGNTTATRLTMLDLETSPTFQYASFGGSSIVIGDAGQTIIDSYDSAKGAYDAVTNVGAKGDIGTNGDGNAATVDLLIKDIKTPTKKNAVKGTGWITSGDTYSVPSGQPLGGIQTHPDVVLPPIIFPSDLAAIPLEPDLYVNTVYTCDRAMHVQSIYITSGGEFQMTDNCQIYVESSSTPGGNFKAPTYSPNALDTIGNGKMVKMGTGRTQVFIRMGKFDFDGGGLTWSSAIAEQDRRPGNLQIYADTKYSLYPDNRIVQRWPFYGVVYVRNGDLLMQQGTENGVAYPGQYYGAFIATGYLQDTGNTTLSQITSIHYDESVGTLAIDGSGSIGSAYRVRAGSWNVK